MMLSQRVRLSDACKSVMNEHAKTIVDLSSITVVLATLVEWLPAAAALASLIWSIIRIYETETVQRWIKKCRKQL